MNHLIKKLFYKKGTNEIYWENIIVKSVLLCVFLSFFIPGMTKRRKEDLELEKNKDYTVGEIIKVKNYLKQPLPTVYFKYYGGTRFYENSDAVSTRGHDVAAGKRYLVKFSPNNPTHSYILLDYPVPDNVYAPKEGWDSLPYWGDN